MFRAAIKCSQEMKANSIGLSQWIHLSRTTTTSTTTTTTSTWCSGLHLICRPSTTKKKYPEQQPSIHCRNSRISHYGIIKAALTLMLHRRTLPVESSSNSSCSSEIHSSFFLQFESLSLMGFAFSFTRNKLKLPFGVCLTWWNCVV